jgi:hypothetical protein
VDAVDLQNDTRRVLERRDRDSGKLDVRWQKDAVDAAAGTTTAETLVWSNPRNGVRRRIVSASFTPADPVIASAAAYARIRLSRRPEDGSASAHLATLSSTKTWRAWVPSPLAFDGGPPLVEPGASVTFRIDKIGGGVQLPKGTLLLTLVDG